MHTKARYAGVVVWSWNSNLCELRQEDHDEFETNFSSTVNSRRVWAPQQVLVSKLKQWKNHNILLVVQNILKGDREGGAAFYS